LTLDDSLASCEVQ